jgi:6-phosphogluconolactonase (cycloisomerase 2 family)
MISRLNLSRIAVCFAAFALTAVNSFAQSTTHIYMMSNASTGNSVLDYTRNPDGTLSLSATVPTTGKGSGKFLNSSGPVTMHPTGQFLFVVNAGDNTVSSFLVGASGLTFASKVGSGGTYPVSVTAHNKKVYVLNQGGSNNIAGLNLNTTTGVLSPLSGSKQSLSGPSVAAAQVSFTANGEYLIATEKGTNYLDVFPVSAEGVAGPPTLYTSAGITPYGFAFDKKARVYITDANVSGLSSYSIPGGVMTPISGFVADGGGAACWVQINAAGTFAYVINNVNGTMYKSGVSVYSIAANGTITLIPADTIALGTPGADASLTADGANFYYMVIGGSLNAYTVNSNGSLTPITGLTGLVSTVEGMATTI